MKKIEFSTPLSIGEKVIDEINILPLHFADLVKTWAKAERTAGDKPEAAIQRERIKHQVHFMSGKERVVPDDAQIRLIPIGIARLVIDSLDIGQGEIGKLLHAGDGITDPVLYKLGTPIEMKSGDKGVIKISELEFKATTYGELEDFLAAGSDSLRAMELLKTVAKPVEIESLMRLPGWALDKITAADGIGIIREVLPRF